MGDAPWAGDRLPKKAGFFALRWAAAEPGSFQFPFLDLNRAGNWKEFTAALARFPGPGPELRVCRRRRQHRLSRHRQLPIRKNFDGDVPVDGSSGDYEWDGFIPFDQLPSFYNPPRGWIVTANQNPFPEDYPYRVGGSFRAALSVDGNSRPAHRAQGMEAG